MSAKSRLKTAIEDDLLTLPDGAVSLVRPKPDVDLAALAPREISVVTTFAPDHDQWTAAGYDVRQKQEQTAISIVHLPRSKAFAKSLVAEAAQRSDIVVVDGDKTDGIDSIFKACRKELGDLPSVTKNHGRIFWFAGTDALSGWEIDGPTKGPHGFYTQAGVFSDGAIDKGSELLVAALPETMPPRVADFGAGWGYLSAALMLRAGLETLDVIEAENLALYCAQRNVSDDRATFHWADVRSWEGHQPYDAIVTNPPFHTGREGDPELGRSFIRSAAEQLSAKGTLWLVANRHLPYEETLSHSFQRVEPLQGSGGFKLFKASRPRR